MDGSRPRMQDWGKTGAGVPLQYLGFAEFAPPIPVSLALLTSTISTPLAVGTVEPMDGRRIGFRHFYDAF